MIAAYMQDNVQCRYILTPNYLHAVLIIHMCLQNLFNVSGTMPAKYQLKKTAHESISRRVYYKS
jgi:hypothetical protein